MKNVLTAAAFLALLSGVAEAKSKTPVMYDSCRGNVSIPSNSNANYFMSKDCSTVFVLPGERIPLRVTDVRINPEINEEFCREVDSNKDRLRELDREMAEISDRIAEIFTNDNEEDDALVESLLARYKAISEAIPEIILNLPYSESPGATVMFNLSTDIDAHVKAFREANKKSGLKFLPARLSRAHVYFAGRPTEEILGEAITSVDFPGLSNSAEENFPVRPELLSRGIQGEFTFSQSQVCYEMRRKDGTLDRSKLSKENVNTAGVVANLYYWLKVKSGDNFVEQGFTSGSVRR